MLQLNDGLRHIGNLSLISAPALMGLLVFIFIVTGFLPPQFHPLASHPYALSLSVFFFILWFQERAWPRWRPGRRESREDIRARYELGPTEED